jgi:hypothetical protein
MNWRDSVPIAVNPIFSFTELPEPTLWAPKLILVSEGLRIVSIPARSMFLRSPGIKA